MVDRGCKSIVMISCILYYIPTKTLLQFDFVFAFSAVTFSVTSVTCNMLDMEEVGSLLQGLKPAQFISVRCGVKL